MLGSRESEASVSHQDEFFKAVSTRNIVRASVRAIVVVDGQLLVQRPADEPASFYAFIGGEYEVGDTFESRLRREFAEETSAHLVTCTYRFVVENRFMHAGREIHGLDHFCEVTLDRREIDSRESHLTQHWLSLDRIEEQDLRPTVVRDAIRDGTWREARHLVSRLAA
jgi:8-oxo-dGTP pyrophosphatase MutT (NUDIX family)